MSISSDKAVRYTKSPPSKELKAHFLLNKLTPRTMFHEHSRFYAVQAVLKKNFSLCRTPESQVETATCVGAGE
jgi:hypothetical protein